MAKKKESTESLRTKFKFASINKSYRMIYGHQAAALLEAILAQMEYWESKGKLKTKGKLPNYTTTYADLSYHSGVAMNTLQKLGVKSNPLNILISQGLIIWVSTGPGTPHILKISISNIDKLLAATDLIDKKVKEIMTFLTDYRKKKDTFMQELSKANGDNIIQFLNHWVSIVKNELFEDISESTCRLAIGSDDLAIGSDDLAIPTTHRQATKNSNSNNSNTKKISLKTPSPAAGQRANSFSSPTTQAKELVAKKRLAPKQNGYGGLKHQGDSKEEIRLNEFYHATHTLDNYNGVTENDQLRFASYTDKKIQQLIIDTVFNGVDAAGNKTGGNNFPSKAFKMADVLVANPERWEAVKRSTNRGRMIMNIVQESLSKISLDIKKAVELGKPLPRVRKEASTVQQELDLEDFIID